jgi:hypothetical protein
MSSTESRRALAPALTTLLVLGAGCATTESSDRRATPGLSATSSTPDRPTASDGTVADAPQEDPVQISITIGEQRFAATLADSAAAEDLLAQLPVTVEMTDHGGVEKTGPLPQPLSLEGQPEGADPNLGDLGYYAPGHDLVLYYGDQSYFPGIVILGRLDDDAPERLAALDGSITATVEAVS